MTRPPTGSRTYLIECFVASADSDAVADAHARLDAACADLRSSGADIDCLGAWLVPEDELVYHVVVAAGLRIVRRAARAAGLRVERVVASVAVAPTPARSILVPGPSTRQGDPDGFMDQG